MIDLVRILLDLIEILFEARCGFWDRIKDFFGLLCGGSSGSLCDGFFVQHFCHISLLFLWYLLGFFLNFKLFLRLLCFGLRRNLLDFLGGLSGRRCRFSGSGNFWSELFEFLLGNGSALRVNHDNILQIFDSSSKITLKLESMCSSEEGLGVFVVKIIKDIASIFHGVSLVTDLMPCERSIGIELGHYNKCAFAIINQVFMLLI